MAKVRDSAIVLIFMEDAVTQTQPSVSGVERESVSLDCTYETAASNYYLYWYKQPPGESLIFLFRQYSGGTKRNERLEDGKRSSLHITDSQLGDSGSYLCAVDAQGTARGNAGRAEQKPPRL
uniref:Ig-like domain-containing protein n=1 Tax=Terrapene triunguis TaxID=2587831 RepID=A0A674J297_9SAUR